jgi:hypothetical protein
MLQLYS